MTDIKRCARCGNPFIPNKFWQKYCSRMCNNAAYYARKAPPSLDEPTTATPAQEAEFERRKNLIPPTPQDDPDYARKLAERAEEIIQNQGLDKLGYGTGGDK